MKDRVPTKVVNGAIRMEQLDENGNSLGYVYLKRADEPSEEGTPYNKNSILQDKTATALGVTVQNPTANDAFAKIATNISTIKGNITTANNNISTINGKINTANNNINTINGNISTIRSDLGNLNERIGIIDNDISTINGNIITIMANKQNKTNYIIEDYEDEGTMTEFNWELTTSSWKELYFEFKSYVDGYDTHGKIEIYLITEYNNYYNISENLYSRPETGRSEIRKIYISGGIANPLITVTQSKVITDLDELSHAVESFNIIPSPALNERITAVRFSCYDMDILPLQKIEIYDAAEVVS